MQYKPKIKAASLMFILGLLMSILMLQPMNVQAYNGGQGNGSENAGSLTGGISTDRQGFVLYIADKNTGEAVTSLIAVSRQDQPFGDKSGTYVTKVQRSDTGISQWSSQL